ncbi:hypothetical protein [Streptomyces sp. NPDC002520]
MNSTNEIDPNVPPSGSGCAECDAEGNWWLHLRRCTACDHVGCCEMGTGHEQHRCRHTKLGCAIESALSAPDGIEALDRHLRVGPAELDHAREFATVMTSTFGFTTQGMVDEAGATAVGGSSQRLCLSCGTELGGSSVPSSSPARLRKEP